MASEADAFPNERLPDETLLQICKITSEHPAATPELLAELGLVLQLIGHEQHARDGRLEHAIALLAHALNQIAAVTQLHPAGTSVIWMERKDLERTAIQMAGMMWVNSKPDAVEFFVSRAVGQALRLGFLDSKTYDTWEPGMRRRSGHVEMVAATPYGVDRAWALANTDLTAAQSSSAISKVLPSPAPGTSPPAPVTSPIAPSSELRVDEATFTISSGGRSHRFSARGKQLFALMARICRRPGQRVLFDALRDVGDVWDGAQVEDSTIKGAVSRLREELRQGEMPDLADEISTGTYNNRQYVLFDPPGPNSD